MKEAPMGSKNDKNRGGGNGGGGVEVPPWLQVMHTATYFEICLAHEGNKRNELDHFCIDCMESFCFNCLSSHAPHKYIKIRRYVYCEVTKKQDMSKFFDCSGIQAYHTNKSKVLFLKQRSTQNLPQHTTKDHNCIVCGRNLQDASLYCSIACKISTLLYKENGNGYKRETRYGKDEIGNGKGVVGQQPSPKRLKLRKGIALRAPFF